MVLRNSERKVIPFNSFLWIQTFQQPAQGFITQVESKTQQVPTAFPNKIPLLPSPSPFTPALKKQETCYCFPLQWVICCNPRVSWFFHYRPCIKPSHKSLMEVQETDDIKERISCVEEIWRHATWAAEGGFGTQVQGRFLWQNLFLGLIPWTSRTVMQSVSKARLALAK